MSLDPDCCANLIIVILVRFRVGIDGQRRARRRAAAPAHIHKEATGRELATVAASQQCACIGIQARPGQPNLVSRASKFMFVGG